MIISHVFACLAISVWPILQKDKPDDSDSHPLPPRAQFRLGDYDWRQGASVSSLAFSEAGDVFASGTGDWGGNQGDCGIYIWKLGKPRSILHLKGHWDRVTVLAFGKNNLLASGSSDSTVRIWDIGAKKEIKKWGMNSAIGDVSFVPGGGYLAAVGDHKKITFFDMKSKKKAFHLKNPDGDVYKIAISPNGKFLVSGGYVDNRISFWDIEKRKRLRIYLGHAGIVTCAAFSPNGTSFATASKDGTLRLWQTGSERCLEVFAEKGDVPMGIAYSPDGRFIASCTLNGFVCIYDSKSKKRIFRHRSNKGGPLTSVAFALDGKTLVFGGSGRFIRFLDLSSKIESKRIGHRDFVTATCFSPDGSKLASGGYDRTIRIWSTSSGKEERVFRDCHDGDIHFLRFVDKGKGLISASRDGSVKKWSLGKGSPPSCKSGLKAFMPFLFRKRPRPMLLQTTTNSKFVAFPAIVPLG